MDINIEKIIQFPRFDNYKPYQNETDSNEKSRSIVGFSEYTNDFNLLTPEQRVVRKTEENEVIDFEDDEQYNQHRTYSSIH